MPVSGIPWHPVAFGVAYVSLYWVEAAVSPLAAIRALLIVIAAIGLLQVGLSLALRDAGRGALVTSVIVLAAISKVVIRTVATAPQMLGAPLAALWLGAIVLAILLGIRIARRAGARWSLGTVNRTLNIFSVALVGVAIVSAVSSGRVAMVMTDLGQGSTWTPTSGSQGQQSGGPQQEPTFTSSCWTGIQAAARSIVCSASTIRRFLMRSSSADSMSHKTAGRTTCGRTSR